MREKSPELAVAKAALKPASKICPMTYRIIPLEDEGCTVYEYCKRELCAWWSGLYNCCGVLP